MEFKARTNRLASYALAFDVQLFTVRWAVLYLGAADSSA